MTEYKTPESQREAVKRYEQKNKDKRQYMNKRNATKNFILKTATDEDIQLVEEWLAERKQHGKQD